MYRSIPALLIVLAASACSSTPPSRCADPTVSAAPHSDHAAPADHTDHAAHADHEGKPASAPPSKPSGEVFDLAASKSDKDIQPQILFEDANLKIVVVTIKAGATMPEHATPVPVTVQTISGKGEMMVSGSPHVLEPSKISRLDASAPHALVAAADAPLVVLVHYLKGGAKLDDHHGH